VNFRRKSPLLFADSSLFFEESPQLFFESRGGGEKVRRGGGRKGGKVRRRMGDFEVEKGLRGGDTARGK
jgi:hypothetical protein